MASDGVSVTPYAGSRTTRQTAGGVIALFSVSALIGLALGPLAGWLWVLVADPPSARLYSDGGIYLGEQALNQQSGVTLWFFVVGAAFGVAAGLVVCWLGQRFGWLTVVAVLALCLIGTVLSRYAGVHVFGPDPKAEAASAATGDSIRLGVQVDTWVAYLGWPIGGVLGALAAIAGWKRYEQVLVSPTVDPFVAPSSDPTTGTDHGRNRTSTSAGDAGTW